MTTTLALCIGFLAGAHTSTWGMYKDAPHEGFTYRKYFRTIALSAVIAVVVQRWSGLDVTQAPNAVVFFGLVYLIERGITEFYKTFLREEDQSKYFIPMQFHVQGRVVQDRRTRWLAGAGWLASVLAIITGIWLLQQRGPSLPPWLAVLVIGSIGGWISAFGGAWKDAPIEGFEWLKFFRSPASALFFAAILACFTESYLFMALAAEGYTVAAIETYKTFFHPNKPRGKWAGKPILYQEMLHRRQNFLPVYAAIWALVIAGFVLAFWQPHHGLLCP